MYQSYPVRPLNAFDISTNAIFYGACATGKHTDTTANEQRASGSR